MAANEIRMKMTIDSFITNTRVHTCWQDGCKHNLVIKRGSTAALDCQLKVIEIGRSGQCLQFEPHTPSCTKESYHG